MKAVQDEQEDLPVKLETGIGSFEGLWLWGFFGDDNWCFDYRLWLGDLLDPAGNAFSK